MNIEDLKANGGIVESQLTQRTAYWNGSEITFYVRKLSFGDVDRIYNGENLDASQAAEMISKAVRLGDNGDEALTYEQAYSLDPNLATVFAEHVMEVNGVGEDAGDPKASTPAPSSGSKSRKSSAARSPKPASA